MVYIKSVYAAARFIRQILTRGIVIVRPTDIYMLQGIRIQRGEEEPLKQKSPAEQLKQFLNFVDESRRLYSLAEENVKKEEKRQIDLLHEIEFSASYNERNKAATKLYQCRKGRRHYKDMMKRYEQVVIFLSDSQNQKVINQLRQLLGRQRREEEYLDNERTYKMRA